MTPRPAAARAASWPVAAGWGAGLIQLSLGAGAITGAQGGAALTAAGVALVILGGANLGWGAATLACGRLVVPRASVVGSLAGLVVLATALAIAPARMPVIAVAAASALLVTAGIGGARATRESAVASLSRSADCAVEGSADAAPGGRDRVALRGLIVSAALVAALVTPVLSATDAGRLAPDHGGHDLVFEDGHTH